MPRRENDHYETPAWVVDALLDNHSLPMRGSGVLEPCAGSGAIIRAIDQYYFQRAMKRSFPFVAVDIQPDNEKALRECATFVRITDFLAWEPHGTYNVIITNPPYSIAQQVVERALEIARRQDEPAEVIMLLRLAFLESEKRYEFWRQNPPSKVLVLAARPSFTGDGKTDSAAYAWFVWSPSCHSQEIRVIDSPTRPKRDRGKRE